MNLKQYKNRYKTQIFLQISKIVLTKTENRYIICSVENTLCIAYQPLGETSHFPGCVRPKGFNTLEEVRMKQLTTRKTAILVDGGYYRKRANALWGDKDAKRRAEELFSYCLLHISETDEPRDLYRIFYYDCPPMSRTLTHPLTGSKVDFSAGPLIEWFKNFTSTLVNKRKVALRMGELAENQAYYALDVKVLTELLAGKKTKDDLSKDDFHLVVKQKGVDMRIGLDVASLAYGHQVDQIILIAGDSDFLPVAKMARRNGIDFILDPMQQKTKANFLEHIDGLETYTSKMYAGTRST